MGTKLSNNMQLESFNLAVLIIEQDTALNNHLDLFYLVLLD